MSQACLQVKNMSAQKSEASIVILSNYEQKTCSLKPGQRSNRRPHLEVALALKQYKRLSMERDHLFCLPL